MPVRRDQHGEWFFRTTIKKPDGTKARISGWPGTPGPYQDLARTQKGATEAERRAIAFVLSGKVIAREVTPATKETPKQTVRELADTYLTNYKPSQKPSTRRNRRQVVTGHLVPWFGSMCPSDVTQVDVDQYAGARLKTVKVKTINGELSVLSTMLRYMTGSKPDLVFHLDGMGAEINAVAMVDVERLLVAADDPRYRVVVLLAAEAGLRTGEIRGLQWTDVKAGQVTIRRALDKETGEVIAPKHNKSRSIPLSPRIVAALATLPRRGVWVVSRLDGEALGYYELLDAIRAVYARAEVARPPKPLHCLRHTFGTQMARKVPLGVLQELMGHAEVVTTMRYVDVSEDDKRDAIALVFGGLDPAVAATRHQDSPKTANPA